MIRIIRHRLQCATCTYSLRTNGHCVTATNCNGCENRVKKRCNCCDEVQNNESLCPYYRRF